MYVNIMLLYTLIVEVIKYVDTNYYWNFNAGSIDGENKAPHCETLKKKIFHSAHFYFPGLVSFYHGS
jgi:hypothetical protein